MKFPFLKPSLCTAGFQGFAVRLNSQTKVMLGLLLAVQGWAAVGNGVAADQFWDTNGSTAGAGATPTGTWESTSWSTSSVGTSTTGAWIGGNTAVFSAGTDAANPFTVTLSGAQSIGGITVQEGSPTLTGGSLALTGAATPFSITGTATIASSITGSGLGIDVTGGGRLNLTGTSSYSGVTTFGAGTIVNVATLSNYGVNGSLGNRAVGGDAGTSNVSMRFVGGTLQYTGTTAQSTDRGIRVGTAGATIDASGANSAATMSFTKSTVNEDIWDSEGSRTLRLTGSNTGNNTFAINWQEREGALNKSNIIKSGAGTWVLTNSHNSDAANNAYNAFGGYSGGTRIEGGTLGFANNAIGGGLIDFTGNATLRWEAGNTQDVTLAASGSGVARGIRINDGVMATFDTNGNNVTLSNALQLGAGGTGGLTKTGAGSLTLSGSNTYSGTTVINGGSLVLGANNVLPTAPVQLAGGSLVANGKTDTVGTLLLSSSSVIDMAGAGSALAFANSTALGWTGILSVWNWPYNNGAVRFGTTSAGLTSTQLSQIQMYSGSGTGTVYYGKLDSNGYLIAVPEPGAVISCLLLVAGIGWRERRHFMRGRQALT